MVWPVLPRYRFAQSHGDALAEDENRRSRSVDKRSLSAADHLRILPGMLRYVRRGQAVHQSNDLSQRLVREVVEIGGYDLWCCPVLAKSKFGHVVIGFSALKRLPPFTGINHDEA
jgi:hypothetical protein